MTSQREQSGSSSFVSRFTFRLPSMWIVLFFVVLLAAPGAFAQTSVDFFCNLGMSSTCTGTVAQSGSNFSSTGITVFNDSGPFSSSTPFTLAFNTATKTISIDGTGADLGINLIGTIVSFVGMSTPGSSAVGLIANFSALPASVASQLGSTTGSDTGFVIYMTKTGSAASVDLLISPTPEPASMLLVGTGLLAIGGLLRKRQATA